MSCRSVTELVAAHLEEWHLPSTEEAVFGTRDPSAIGFLLDQFCQASLGSGITSGLFYRSSAGCVAGIELHDRRQIVIKAYQDRWSAAFLAAVCRVQRHLAASGFPCPDVVLAAGPLGLGLASVESFLPDPGSRFLSAWQDMAASAAGLAWQIDLCRHLAEPDLEQHPLKTTADGLYPQPHSPFFDFSIQADEAAWIDNLAARSKAVRETVSEPVTIAHTDWSARNIRIRRGELVTVYDWDSLAAVPEPVAVGQAAATWNSTGEAGEPDPPTPEQATAYISSYETATGHQLTQQQRKAALAAALWVLCYTARCEHSIEVTTGKKIRRARARLAADGARYLP